MAFFYLLVGLFFEGSTLITSAARADGGTCGSRLCAVIDAHVVTQTLARVRTGTRAITHLEEQNARFSLLLSPGIEAAERL